MLTDNAIRKATREKEQNDKPLKLTDSGGLYLDIRPSGQMIWRYRFRISGKESIFTIGEYPKTSIREARRARDSAGDLVREGKNPTQEKKASLLRKRYENAQTFGAVLDEWLDSRDWTPATRRNRTSQINLHIRPYLQSLPMKEITPMMILDVLRRAEAPSTSHKTTGRGARIRETGGAGVARRLRQCISSVFDLATITARAEYNPAGPLRGALTKTIKTVHKTPLTPAQVGSVLRAVDDYHGYFVTVLAFRVLWWSLARPVEVTAARWEEFDLDSGLWVIPGERMKGGEEHRIPLPRQAVDCLLGYKATTSGVGYLFPHRDHQAMPMTRDTLTSAARRMKLGFEYSPHATRTTGSTIMNGQGYRYDIIEKQLAHQDPNAVRRSYNRADYLDERREMMQAWADLLDTWRTSTNVVPLKISA